MSILKNLQIPTRNDLGHYELKKLKNKYPDEDIDGLVVLLIELLDSGIYFDLFDIFSNWKEPVSAMSDNSLEIASESYLLTLAHENLNHKPGIFSSDLINYPMFYYFFPFLEWIYSMNLERDLMPDDVLNLFKSGLGEKITFYLLDFDRIEENPEITNDFFQKLKKIKWENRKTKDFYSRMERVLRFHAFNGYGVKEASFLTTQMDIILFLSGCSSVKENRQKIITEDVLIAYKTLFKIISTDISKLI